MTDDLTPCEMTRRPGAIEGRLSLDLDAAPSVVWSHLVESERLGAWLAPGRIEPGVGEGRGHRELALVNVALSGSGTAVKGAHLVDPRTGKPAPRATRTWATAASAAVSDALSTAFFHGSRLASWKTRPIIRLRVASAGASPAIETLPWLGCTSPASTLSKVLFPQPEGPMSDTNDPFGTERSMFWRTSCRPMTTETPLVEMRSSWRI